MFAAVIISLKTGYECADNRCQAQIEDQLVTYKNKMVSGTDGKIGGDSASP